jgi:uncharacterized protein (UPF0333 family)
LNFDNKGQASAEFIFITLIVIIIIGGMVSLIGGAQDQTKSSNVGAARIMGEKIAETVNTVYINGNGYNIDLDLRTLNTAMSTGSNSFNYTATIINNTGLVRVNTGGGNVDIKLVPNKFNGTLNLNNNNVYHVTNVNGTIQIT